MNDDFLHTHRKSPGPGFASRLHQQLQQTKAPVVGPMLAQPRRVSDALMRIAAVFVLLLGGLVLRLNMPDDQSLTQIEPIPASGDPQPITLTNASQLVEMSRLGRGSISHIAWGGDRIAVGGALGVWLYDASALSEDPRLLPGTHTLVTRPVDYNLPSDQVVAVDGETVRIWDAATGQQRAAFESATGATFGSVGLSADGSLVAAGESRYDDARQAHSLTVWDIDTGEQRFTTNQQTPAFGVAFSPTQPTQFAFVGAEAVAMHDLLSGTVWTLSSAQTGNLMPSLAYSPDGSTLAVATETGFMLVDVAHGDIVQSITLGDEDSTPHIVDLAFSPDGYVLAIADQHNGLSLWNRTTGVFSIENASSGAAGEIISSVAYNQASDDPVLASVRDSSVLRFSGNQDTTIRDFSPPVLEFALGPDNGIIATSGADDLIRFWDLEAGVERRMPSQRTQVTDLAFSPDGELLAYSGTIIEAGSLGSPVTTDGGVTLVGVALRQPVRQVGDPNASYLALAFSPDGTALLAADAASRTIQRWHLGAAETNDRVAGQSVIDNASARLIAVRPDGEQIAMLMEPGVLVLRASEPTGFLNRVFELSPNRIYTLFAYSPDSTRLAMAARTGTTSTVWVWDMTANEQLSQLAYTTNTDTISSLSFSPDSSLIAGVVADEGLHVWDAATGSLLFQVSDPYLASQHVAFTADGRGIVSADADGLIRLWGIPGR
ncbi:MAG: WD40 repeat domain-containing protein [Pleurocapsa minor GSE-CHR-MK-17-07R]|jgi:WD40 repeat protein|nr:WD40 repeat domain-containing protein [Pleurocapsa minor GSE-CHR-MK 17-07R]